MKRKKLGGILAAGILVVGLAACAKAPPEVTVEKLELELDTQTLELAIGESYTAGTSMTADGAALTEASLEWSSSDPYVATVVDGVILAQKVGKTTISATAQYGGKNATAAIKVTVTKPEVMLELEEPVLLDLSMEDGGLVAFTFPMDVADVNSVTLGDSEYRIVPQGNQVLIQATYLTPGEYIMTVEQDAQYTSFPVYIASMVIRSAKDLQKATRMSGADKGYFVLGCNIDCTELTEPICFTANSVSENHLGQNRAGFLGGFNGMGYTISNLKVPEYGLFGCIAGSGVVRNVGFTNVKAEVDNVVCLYNAGMISQVYVQGDFSQVLQHSFGPDNKLKNIVAESTRSGAILSGNIASVNTTGYCVSDVYALIMVGENAKISAYSRTPQFNHVSMDPLLRAFACPSKESVPAVTVEDGFNGYWDISSGYPVFISSVQ